MKKNYENNFIERLYKRIENSVKSKNKKTYTKKLLKEGKIKIAQKIGEESSELIIDYLRGSKKRIVEETSDLIYHILVMLYSKKIPLKDIEKELEKRSKNVRRK